MINLEKSVLARRAGNPPSSSSAEKNDDDSDDIAPPSNLITKLCQVGGYFPI